MKLIFQSLGCIFLLLGVYWLLNAETFYQFIESNYNNSSLYLPAVVLRFSLGVLLIVAAKESRYPRVIKVLGIFSIAAATVFALMGQDNFQSFLASIIPAFESYSWVGALLSLGFGGFILYAFSRKMDVHP